MAKKDGTKLLGKGMAKKAAKKLKSRKSRLDAQIESISRGKATQYREK